MKKLGFRATLIFCFLLVSTFLVFLFASSNRGKSFLVRQLPSLYLQDHSLRVLPLGDSLTAGAFMETNGEFRVLGGYRWPLWKKLETLHRPFHFVGGESDGPDDFPEPLHEGHLGWRSEQILEIIPKVLVRWKPDIVLIIIGTNDIAQGKSSVQTIENVSKILRSIRKQLPNTIVFFSGPLPSPNEGLEQSILRLNTSLENLVRAQEALDGKTHWVSLFQEPQWLLNAEDFSDLVHPTQAGYEKMANIWFQHIEPVFK